jgi:adenylate cyclase
MRDHMRAVTERWKALGHDLGFAVGITVGYATLGEVGFEGRYDYTAHGSVANMASRLCDAAASGQILVSPAVKAAVDELVEAEPAGDLDLKGFNKPVAASNVVSFR